MINRFPSYWYGSLHEFKSREDGSGPKAQAMESIEAIGHHMPIMTRNLSTYIVGGWIPFVEFYCGISSRHERVFYEIIQGQQPCKLFIDIDLCTVGRVEYAFCEDGYKRFEDSLPAHVKTLVAEKYSVLFPSTPDMIVLDATTPEKFSRHFIFPGVVFASVVEMGTFVLELVQRIVAKHIEAEWVDRGIYQPGRNFRIYNSKKMKKDNTLRMVSHRHYSEEQRVMASMITMLLFRDVMESDNALLKFATRCHTIIGHASVCSTTLKRRFSATKSHAVEEEHEELYKEVLPIVKKMETDISSFHVESSQYGTYLVWGVKVMCPKKKAKHRNNRTLFKVNVGTRKMHFKCMDPDCRTRENNFGIFGEKYLKSSKAGLRRIANTKRKR